MTSQRWTDDGHLIAALGDGFSQLSAVPGQFAEAAKAAYTYRNVGIELANLDCD